MKSIRSVLRLSLLLAALSSSGTAKYALIPLVRNPPLKSFPALRIGHGPVDTMCSILPLKDNEFVLVHDSATEGEKATTILSLTRSKNGRRITSTSTLALRLEPLVASPSLIDIGGVPWLYFLSGARHGDQPQLWRSRWIDPAFDAVE